MSNDPQQPRILFVPAFYPEFLREFYAANPEVLCLDYTNHREQLLATRFSAVDAYCAALQALGCQADAVILYADALQNQWCREHGVDLTGNVHDQRRQYVAAYVDHYRPDILYVFEWTPLGDAFLAEINPRVRLLVGQVASPLRDDRTYAAYDLMISSWRPIVDYFHKEGKASAYIKLAFDAGILSQIGSGPPAYDVTFVGGFAPSHPTRAAWLERLLQEINIDVFGYGVERLPEASPIRSRHRGSAWGLRMYEVLQRSRMTLNLHAVNEVRGAVATDVANNLRLYEATGMGTCLVTEAKSNLTEMFEPGREVVAYEDERDCVDKVRYYLARENDRAAIALAGQRRTLRDHTYDVRMAELLDVLARALDRTGRCAPSRRIAKGSMRGIERPVHSSS